MCNSQECMTTVRQFLILVFSLVPCLYKDPQHSLELYNLLEGTTVTTLGFVSLFVDSHREFINDCKQRRYLLKVLL